MELKDTAAMMASEDYRERFKAECLQLEIRTGRLLAFIRKCEDAKIEGRPEPEHDCPLALLRAQFDAMAEYLGILRKRSRIEGVIFDYGAKTGDKI